MEHISIPDELHRNSPEVLALGVENTGEAIITVGNRLLGWPDWSGKRVLDVGCGVRFTQTIINRRLPVGMYCGVDVHEPLISFLQTNVDDPRFAFHRWNCFNHYYNTAGEPLTRRSRLPIPRTEPFDLVWLYSVATHTHPDDLVVMLRMLKRYVRGDGRLLCSAILDPSVTTFEDRIRDRPLARVVHNEAFMRRTLRRAGWRIEGSYHKQPDSITQSVFLCAPTRPLPRSLPRFNLREWGLGARSRPLCGAIAHIRWWPMRAIAPESQANGKAGASSGPNGRARAPGVGANGKACPLRTGGTECAVSRRERRGRRRRSPGRCSSTQRVRDGLAATIATRRR